MFACLLFCCFVVNNHRTLLILCARMCSYPSRDALLGLAIRRPQTDEDDPEQELSDDAILANLCQFSSVVPVWRKGREGVVCVVYGNRVARFDFHPSPKLRWMIQTLPVCFAAFVLLVLLFVLVAVLFFVCCCWFVLSAVFAFVAVVVLRVLWVFAAMCSRCLTCLISLFLCAVFVFAIVCSQQPTVRATPKA